MSNFSFQLPMYNVSNEIVRTSGVASPSILESVQIQEDNAAISLHFRWLLARVEGCNRC